MPSLVQFLESQEYSGLVSYEARDTAGKLATHIEDTLRDKSRTAKNAQLRANANHNNAFHILFAGKVYDPAYDASTSKLPDETEVGTFNKVQNKNLHLVFSALADNIDDESFTALLSSKNNEGNSPLHILFADTNPLLNVDGSETLIQTLADRIAKLSQEQKKRILTSRTFNMQTILYQVLKNGSLADFVALNNAFSEGTADNELIKEELATPNQNNEYPVHAACQSSKQALEKTNLLLSKKLAVNNLANILASKNIENKNVLHLALESPDFKIADEDGLEVEGLSPASSTSSSAASSPASSPVIGASSSSSSASISLERPSKTKRAPASSISSTSASATPIAVSKRPLATEEEDVELLEMNDKKSPALSGIALICDRLGKAKTKASLETVNSKDGWNALHYACASVENAEHNVNYILNGLKLKNSNKLASSFSKINPIAKVFTCGETPLHVAARCGNLQLIERVMDALEPDQLYRIAYEDKKSKDKFIANIGSNPFGVSLGDFGAAASSRVGFHKILAYLSGKEQERFHSKTDLEARVQDFAECIAKIQNADPNDSVETKTTFLKKDTFLSALRLYTPTQEYHDKRTKLIQSATPEQAEAFMKYLRTRNDKISKAIVAKVDGYKPPVAKAEKKAIV